MTYTVAVKETLYTQIEVEADDENQAHDIVSLEYARGDILVEDLLNCSIEVLA